MKAIVTITNRTYLSMFNIFFTAIWINYVSRFVHSNGIHCKITTFQILVNRLNKSYIIWMSLVRIRILQTKCRYFERVTFPSDNNCTMFNAYRNDFPEYMLNVKWFGGCCDINVTYRPSDYQVTNTSTDKIGIKSLFFNMLYHFYCF